MFFARLPFNMQNLFAYFITFIWEYGTWYIIVATYFCTIAFLVALCKLLPMSLNDLIMEWQNLHKHSDKVSKIDKRLRFQMKFYDVVRAHSQVEQLSLCTSVLIFKFFLNSN